MFKSENIKELQELSRKAVSELNTQIRIFESSINQTLENVNEDEKSEVEKLKALSTKAINLAKMGKADQAQQLIKDYQDERKGNKPDL